MAIEHASVQVARKPWGAADLQPWSGIDGSADPVGELWFQRIDRDAPDPGLLLKLLFTSAPLSIQVHPSDAFARSIGLSNGKTEAWYILSATPEARVAVGLKRILTPQELRGSIRDGSIAGMTQWRSAVKGDIIFVPAGTIHAIGAGIVLAEIQQRSDTTYRLYDYGRRRALHEDGAVAASEAGPVQAQSASQRLTAARLVLIASPHFVLERIDLQANSHWTLHADRETWLLVIEGHARVGATDAAIGDAFFIVADRADIQVGPDGMSGLIAYPGPDSAVSMLQDCEARAAGLADPSAAHSPASNEMVEART